MSFPFVRSAFVSAALLFNGCTDGNAELRGAVPDRCEALISSYRAFMALSSPELAPEISYRWQDYEPADPQTNRGKAAGLIVVSGQWGNPAAFRADILNDISFHMGSEQFNHRIERAFPEAAARIRQSIIPVDKFIIHPDYRRTRCFEIA